ncbi:SHOCT domain-containing protein [Nocardiopsis gilva]|nr:SHOCT domain-containing protein [Nocardiopsis gilva]
MTGAETGWAEAVATTLAPLLTVAVVIAVAILVLRNTALTTLATPTVRHRQSPPPVVDGPIEMLKERYARGEVDHGEFERRLDVLMRNREEWPRQTAPSPRGTR